MRDRTPVSVADITATVEEVAGKVTSLRAPACMHAPLHPSAVQVYVSSSPHFAQVTGLTLLLMLPFMLLLRDRCCSLGCMTQRAPIWRSDNRRTPPLECRHCQRYSDYIQICECTASLDIQILSEVECPAVCRSYITFDCAGPGGHPNRDEQHASCNQAGCGAVTQLMQMVYGCCARHHRNASCHAEDLSEIVSKAVLP